MVPLVCAWVSLGGLVGEGEFVTAWGQVSSAISSSYYARGTHGEEMRALLAKYKERAEGAGSRSEFSAVVNEMIAEFGDSHFSFTTREDQGFYVFQGLINSSRAPEMAHVGAWFRRSGGGWVVGMVLNGGAAERAGLRVGDRMLSWAGRPFTPVLGFGESRSGVLVYERGGERREAQLEAREERPLDAFHAATQASARVLDHGGKRFGYVRVWTMVDPRSAPFLSNWVLRGPGRATDGMILDLRDGFGGRPEGFFEMFFAPQFRLTWRTGGLDVEQLTGYGRPLVVLTNGGTRSAKEVVSEVFQRSGRGTLVGSATKGDVLGTFPRPIGDWGVLEVPMVEVFFEGRAMERAPVRPDVLVDGEVGAAGEDLVLAKGMEVLAEKSAGE